MSLKPEEDQVFLELGDVIRIIAPTEAAINGHSFYVSYLDPTEVKLTDLDTLKELTLRIQDGTLSDENIESIELRSRDPLEGYAQQHDLVPNKWISIHFGGGVPAIVNGEIISLEEDMIAIRVYPSDKIIYIDFAYQGIPKKLPIIKITDFVPPTPTEEEFPAFPASLEAAEGEPVEGEEGEFAAASALSVDIDQALKGALLEADDVVFGDALEEITQFVPVAEEEMRYGIEVQTDDLLNEMLSTIPSSERTRRVLNGIHTMIERYKQLRMLYSKVSATGEISRPDLKGANYKPLVERLHNLSQDLYWLVPIVRNRRVIYDMDIDEEDEDSDIVQTTLALAQTQIYQFVQQYKQNVVPDSENKYIFLYRSLNRLLTPYEGTNNMADLITEQEVHAEYTTLADNMGNFTASTVCGNQLEQRRFIVEKYNLGLTHLESNGPKTNMQVAKRVPLTPNDTMDLVGFMVLPEAILRYSHIQLPNTALIVKAQLNLVPFNYWSLLTQRQSVTVRRVPEAQDIKLWEGGEGFLEEFQAIMLEQSGPYHGRADGVYRHFLEMMIPKTRILFTLIRKYIRNSTSYLKIIEYLEPFLVYPSDISFKQYQTILHFMEEKILLLKKDTLKYREKYLTYSRSAYGPHGSTGFVNSYLFHTLDSRYVAKFKALILQKYSLTEATTAEFVKKLLTTDSGRLYTSALAWGESDLFISVEVDDLIQQQVDSLVPPEGGIDAAGGAAAAAAAAAGEEPVVCRNFTLAKYYIDIGDLREDDGTDAVYFDTKYDETRYGIMEEFETQQAEMDPATFNNFLVDHLVTNVGLSRTLALREAEAMITKKRKVLTGDYAYLMDDDYQNIYYIREGDTWVHVPELNGEKLTKSLFCNLQNGCLSIKKNCGNMPINTRKIQARLLDQIMSQYEREDHVSGDELLRKLEQQFRYNLANISRLEYVVKQKNLYYDQQHTAIGSSLEERDIVVSPNSELRDMILSQNDFVKRQRDIIKFVQSKCRQAMGEESPYWFYCLDTEQPLLPTFYKILADAYFAADYGPILSRVVAERGEKSDDGDKVVDKHSGYLIQMLDYEEAEGYDESGYKIVSRALLEEDIGDMLMKMSFKQPDTGESEEERVINNIVLALSKAMGISIGSQNRFIIKSVVDKLNDYLPTESAYKAMRQKAAQSKRRIGSYEDIRDDAILYFTLGYFLVAIQCSMPSIRSNKTFPGCVRSFRGYPLEGEGDTSGLTYLVCVALGLRSRTRPWQRLPRANRKNILKVSEHVKTKLKRIMDKQILSNTEVVAKMIAKREYMAGEPPVEHIPAAFDVRQWLTFLPPLHPIRIAALRSLPKGFENSLTGDIETASAAQFDKLAVLAGRRIYLSLHIQELVQRVINKETLLLENPQNEPLIENACCSVRSEHTTAYFVAQERNITKYNQSVAGLDSIYYRIIGLTRPSSIYDPADTKLVYPAVPTAFSEKVIYAAFIRFCLYNSGLRLDEETYQICGVNASNYKKSDSIETKIEILKREGHDYSRDNFRRLMNIINRRNTVDITLVDHSVLTQRYIFEEKLKDTTFLRRIKGTPLEEFVTLSMDILDTFEYLLPEAPADDDPIEKMVTFLDQTTSRLADSVLKPFLLKTGESEQLFGFIDKFDSWKLRGENIYMSPEDETAITIRSYVQTYVTNILRIYPAMIMNAVDYRNARIPPQWKLSSLHATDIQHIIDNEHHDLYKFYHDVELNKILQTIFQSSDDILVLLFLLPFFADIRIHGETHRQKTILNGALLRKILKFLTVYSLTLYTRPFQTAGPRRGRKRAPSAAAAAAAAAKPSTIEDEILLGQQEEIEQTVSNLLITYLGIMATQKEILNISNREITQDVLKSKEKEKAKITRRLGDLSQDERNVEIIMKNHRLGRWNLGQTRALFEYDEEQYEKERQSLEEDALMELRLDNIDGVTERTRQIYKIDALEEHYQQKLEDLERGREMALMAEDDDFGERDGDEGF